MKLFDNLTADEVTTVHNIYQFLRKLKVIGIIMTETSRSSHSESGRPILYKLEYVGYDESMKNKLTPEEHFDTYFRASQVLDLMYRQTD
jgi:hypothetical protein